MTIIHTIIRVWILLLLSMLYLAASSLSAQDIPAPADIIGFDPGTDYMLADYTQLEEYYKAVSAASDRIIMEEIGSTHHNNTLWLLTISSPENLGNLDRYRDISKRLALAKNLQDDEAKELAQEGKAVVWIDSGLHSPELAHGQHNPSFVYHMATDQSEETLEMLDEVILLNMPMMNPDGHEIVVDWYREQRDTEFELTSPPVVYHEYIGHDNNRDWYMLLQNESQAVAKVLYETWYPQIVLNHHQMGEMPPRMFIPPFDDPVNPNIPALAVRGTNLVGEHMANRFAAENKPGIIQGITFNMWWNGGMRTVPYFHNMIGILTESTHRSPVPKYWDEEDIPDTIVRGSNVIPMKEPSIFYPDPWEGGWTSLSEMVEYHTTASLGVMDIAAKRKYDWLYNIYLMGRNAIELGENESPYAYIITAEQWDAPEAIEMLKVLKRGGIEISKTTASTSYNGESFPEGSFIIYASQAFRPHLIDLMEPQSYPDRRLYPDGPPEPPYDMAGWTLPLQMGVNVVRIEESIDVESEIVDQIDPFRGTLEGSSSYGFLIPSNSNMSAKVVNSLISDHTVYRITEEFTEQGITYQPGAFIIESNGNSTKSDLQNIANEIGLSLTGLSQNPEVEKKELKAPSIAMYQSWTANIDEGWTRWVFDNYGFTYTTLRDQDIRNNDLSEYDIIILPAQEPSSILSGNDPGSMPEQYIGGLGLEGAINLKRYAEAGGTILAWDGATDFLINNFGLPVRNHLRNVSRDDFFIPGSIVKLTSDNTHPIAYGMQDEHGAFFVTRRGSQSRSFTIIEPAEAEDRRGAEPDVEVFAHFAEEDILMSGWALGEDNYLAGKPAALKVGLGEGTVILLGIRPQLRAQPRATFKYIFNSIYESATVETPVESAD